MYNNARKREKDRRLWSSDASSLSSSASSEGKKKHKAKRFRNDIPTHIAANIPPYNRTEQPTPFNRTELYHHEETSQRSLVNSQTKDGLATWDYRASHAGPGLPNPSLNPFLNNPSLPNQVVSNQMVPNQLVPNQLIAAVGETQKKKLFELSYSNAEGTKEKKKKKDSIRQKIEATFDKITTKEGHSEFVQYILNTVSKRMSPQHLKKAVKDFITSEDDFEKKMLKCKEIQRDLNFYINDCQTELTKKKMKLLFPTI